MIDGGTLFVILFVGMGVLFVAVYTLWHILHFILCKKYDDLLFREPYFRGNDLTVYRVWPFSLARSMGYILLLGVPKLAKMRRFKGVTIDRSNIFFLILFSRILLFLGGLLMLFGLFIMVWSSYDMIFLDLDDPGQPPMP